MTLQSSYLRNAWLSSDCTHLEVPNLKLLTSDDIYQLLLIKRINLTIFSCKADK